MLQRKERSRNILAVISTIFSFLLIGAGMAFDFSQFLPNVEITLKTVSLFGALVFIVTIVWYIYSQNTVINAVTPNIVFRKVYFQDGLFPFMENHPFLGEADSVISVGAKILRIDVFNNPKNPSSDNVAKMISAMISYYDEFGSLIKRDSNGRWATNEYPKSRVQIPNVLSAEIESNGNTPATLDLALKTVLESNKDGVYIFNNETLFFESEKMNGEDFFLGENIIFAHIKLKGARVDEERWVKFSFNKNICGLLEKRPNFEKRI